MWLHMDENKDKKLGEIGYRINRTCGQCVSFEPGKGDFGTCVRFKYQHLKHTGEARQLSVNINGGCDLHVLSPLARAKLALFEKYLK